MGFLLFFVFTRFVITLILVKERIFRLNTALNRSLISGAVLDNDDFETLPETIPPDDDDSGRFFFTSSVNY